MLFRLFKHKDIEEFATSVAERFAKRYAPDIVDDALPANAQKLEAAMSSVHSLVGDFHKRTPLGVYKRAELANALKWELKERGYRKAFINTVVYDMLIHLASSKKL